MRHVGEASRRNGQSELGPQQVRDLRQRDAQVRVQPHDQRDDSGAELHAGRPQRVGGLQRVTTVDAPPTLRAVANLDVEAPHDRAHHGELFLILRRHAGHRDRAATVRTPSGHRRRVGLVDRRRARAARLPAVVRTGPPAGPPPAPLRPLLGEGGGLPEPGAARGGQLLFEVVDLARQAVAVAFQPVDLVLQTLAVALAPRHFLAQTCDFVVQAPDQIIAGVVGKTRTLVGHARVMSHSRQKYNPNFWIRCGHRRAPAKRRPSILRSTEVQFPSVHRARQHSGSGRVRFLFVVAPLTGRAVESAA